MPQASEEIRGVLIQVVGGRVLLPNATVSEIITLSDPERLADAPAWLLGRVPWRGWRVPLFSFAVLAGLAPQEPQQTARVCILKAFGGHRRLPFLAMLAQGFPRLATLRPDVVTEIPQAAELAPGVASWVSVHEESAVIPDMGEIERMIAAALGADASAATA